VGQKNVPLYFCPYLGQKSTNFQSFFTVAFCGQLATKLLLNIPPHVNCVTTLPCEIQTQEKLTIIDSKRVDKQNMLPTENAVNDLYDATLC